MPAASTLPQRDIDQIRAGVVKPQGVRNDDADRRPWARKQPFRTCPSHLFHPSQKSWNFASPPDTLSGMHKIIEIFADRAALHTEILALRQQVAVLKRKRPRPLLRKADRVFWVILSCLWPGWRRALVIVRPETVIGWHRKGFRLFWTWKSRRGKPGRPPVSREIRYLVLTDVAGEYILDRIRYRSHDGRIARPRGGRGRRHVSNFAQQNRIGMHCRLLRRRRILDPSCIRRMHLANVRQHHHAQLRRQNQYVAHSRRNHRSQLRWQTRYVTGPSAIRPSIIWGTSSARRTRSARPPCTISTANSAGRRD